MKVGDSKPAYMAIASAPAAKGSEIELLIKNQGPTAELLCNVKAGQGATCVHICGLLLSVRRRTCGYVRVLHKKAVWLVAACVH